MPASNGVFGASGALSRADSYFDLSANPVDSKVLDFKGTAVIVRLNEATKGKKDPKATVYQDIYRNGELIIRGGTPVKMTQKKGWTIGNPWTGGFDRMYKTAPKLDLYNFSTNSVYGRNIPLNGAYQFQGELNKEYRAAIIMLCIPGPNALFPVWIPLLCAGKKQVKIPSGTYLWLEME